MLDGVLKTPIWHQENCADLRGDLDQVADKLESGLPIVAGMEMPETPEVETDRLREAVHEELEREGGAFRRGDGA